jgi:VWFA-related protein
MRICAFIFCAAAFAAQQTQQSVIRSRVTMVPLDVRVVDKDGKPITDLTAADFTVAEDGARQTIAHFGTQRLTADPSAVSAPLELLSERGGDAAPPAQNRRVFLIVLSRGRHQAFKHGDALANFIGSSLMPQDAVAMTAWNRATDFTTDHARLRETASRYAQRHERIEGLLREWFEGIRGRVQSRGPIPPHIQREIDWVFEPADQAAPVPVTGGHPGFAEFMRRSVPAEQRLDFTRMLAGLNYLRFVAGEKRLVWFLEFANPIPRPTTGRGIAAMAAANRIAIDIIQTGGTIGAPPARFGPLRNDRGPAIIMSNMPSSSALSVFMWKLQDARETADATGGLGSTLERGEQAFAALDQFTSFSYLLAYYPSNTSVDGAFRDIAVRVNRPGARVVARNGYYATAGTEPLDLREYTTAERLREAINRRTPFADIGVRVVKITRRSPTDLEADIRLALDAVAVTEKDGLRLASIELAAYASGARGQAVGDVQQRVDLELLPARWAEVIRDGMEMTVRLTIKGQARTLKVVAYDYAGDNLGSTTVTLERR